MEVQRQLMKRLQRVLRKWPEDPSRKGRDLGEYLRQTYVHRFKEQCTSDAAAAAASLESLERLGTNYYRKRYPREKELSFIGETVKDNPWILSNDNLEAMQEKSRSLWEKITGRRKPRLGEKH